jgi:hypothetical protein
MTSLDAPTETTSPYMAALISYLEETEASSELTAWVKTQPDPQTAWDTCKRSDWLMLLLAESTVPKNDRRFRRMAREFAKTLSHLPPEDRRLKAFEVAWNASRNAVWHAAEVAAAADEDAAWATAWAAARDAARAEHAEVVRRYFPQFPEINA